MVFVERWVWIWGSLVCLVSGGGEVVVVEDRMLRKMRDISTLNKEKGEDREVDEKEEEVEQPRQDSKGRV